jgi:hypothetical protein
MIRIFWLMIISLSRGEELDLPYDTKVKGRASVERTLATVR